MFSNNSENATLRELGKKILTLWKFKRYIINFSNCVYFFLEVQIWEQYKLYEKSVEKLFSYLVSV